jgi:hypothetical protein
LAGAPVFDWQLNLQFHLRTLPARRQPTDNMASQQALNKIAPNSPSRAKPSEIEQSIATALYELEVCCEACGIQKIY